MILILFIFSINECMHRLAETSFPRRQQIILQLKLYMKRGKEKQPDDPFHSMNGKYIA